MNELAHTCTERKVNQPKDYDRLTPYQRWLFDRRHPPGIEDEPVVIVDGPDYPLAFLLRLARRRAKKAPRKGRGPVPAELRCAAVVREPTGGKHWCRNRARADGYCGTHRNLTTPGTTR